MFRIESYITPIILSHIDKYVKDFRPQDAQVSLWGGEVAFQNLDVRLDVLEEELQCPFSFVSGHIHELTVRVPWTKIASEPIQITINTIEFVLKLKGDTDGPKPSSRRRSQRNESIQEPPGYMASLVNKIANNISIKLNNIILKYVEEDIVVSMNIQLLTFDSADDKWNPAFVDINPTKVILKKIINISDLTICLDKRNEMGKIDVCQEPILYRCSLQIRLLQKYHIASYHRSSITRIDIFTESIELNVSAQQYPMLLRLIVLGMTLNNGQLKSNSNILAGTAEQNTDDETEDGHESMLMWAWNRIPSIFPTESYEEMDEQKGHILHTCIYINQLNITIKSLEIMTDNIVHSTKKIKYHPIVTLAMNGIYCDSILNGRRWFNMKGGISSIRIYPAEICPCKNRHRYTSILSSASIPYDHMRFLNDSLQDEQCDENKGQQRLYNFSMDMHLAYVTEEILREKTPAIAFDVVHFIDMNDDENRSSTLGSDLEYSNLSEGYLCRAFIGEFNFIYSTSLIHILDTLKEYTTSYDYVPYVEPKPPLTVAQLTPPSTEDYEALMTDIPMKTYQIICNKSILEFHFADEPKSRHVPFVTLEFGKIHLNLSDPYYPNRLVHTTCQLPNAPERLINNCYTKITSKFNDISVRLWYASASVNSLMTPSIEIKLELLIQPDLWSSKTLPKYNATMNCDNLILYLSKSHFILFSLLQEAATATADRKICRSVNDLLLMSDMYNDNLPIIDIQLNNIETIATVIQKTLGVSGHIKSIEGHSYVPKQLEQNINGHSKVPILSHTHEPKKEFLNVIVQIPINFTDTEYPSIISLDLGEFCINNDPILNHFMSYESKQFKQQVSEIIEPSSQTSLRSPKKSMVSLSRKSNGPAESIHSSSDPTATILPPLKTDKINKKVHPTEQRITHLSLTSPFVRNIVVLVNIRQIFVFCPDRSLTMNSQSKSILEYLQQDNDINYVLFSLPSITVNSSHIRNNTLELRPKFPIQLPPTIWCPGKDAFPLNLSLAHLACSTQQEKEKFDIITSIETKITLAITTKPKTENKNKCDHSFAVHIDTPPIQINLCMKQIQFVFTSLNSILSFFALGDISNSEPLEPLEVWERPSSPNFNSELKDFFGTINTISENSSEDTIQEIEEKSSNSLWIQWTLAKLTVALYGQLENQRHKFIIELEDIITSINQQDVYVKIKSKVNTLSGICQSQIGNSDQWATNHSLGFTVLSETLAKNVQETFFDLTITTAQTKNVHNKWGTKRKKNQNFNETITEIMINMQTIDVRLNFKIFESFIPILMLFAYSEMNKPATVTCVADLPLVYFKSQGMRIFIPVLSHTEQCSVLIFKVNEIFIAPTVENPINRIPIRGDIYTKAAQLRIIHIPGSKIEDRQYELMFENISIGSGRWEEIVQYTDPYKNEDAYNENPAFDWNNKTQRPDIETNTIFKDFNLSVTYAPAIIFKNVLVCGQGLEINCLTDLVVDLNTKELSLLNNVLMELNVALTAMDVAKYEIKNLIASIKPNKMQTSNSKHFIKINSRTSYKTILKINDFNNRKANVSVHQLTDSGFESSGNKLQKNKSAESNISASVKLTSIAVIPYDITFVGGIFKFKLYHLGQLTPIGLKNEKLLLLEATLFQPNLFVSQTIVDKTIQLSIFNFIVKFGCEPNETEDSSNEYSDTIFDTSQGDLDRFGIPPPLLAYKEYKTPANEKNLDLHIKRPIFIQFSHKTLEKILALKAILEEFFMDANTANKEPVPITTSNKIAIIQHMLFDANRIDFSLSSIEIDCSSVTDEYDLKVSLSQVKTKIDIVDHPQKLLVNFYLSNFLISTGPLMILSPLSINLALNLIQENWKRDPFVFANINSHCVDVALSPESYLNLHKIHKAFLACLIQYERQLSLMELVLDQQTIDKTENENLTIIPTPKVSRSKMESPDEYYQDDLRAGAFQFIDSNAETTLPLPYQIQIVNKEGGTISWRYPQPRSLTYVQIFPVPFHSSVIDKMKCEIEYYSDAHQEFMPFSEFYLSEKEICELNLPKKKVTAEIWRIKIIQPFVAVHSNFFQEDDSSSDDDDTAHHHKSSPLTKSLKSLGTRLNAYRIDEYMHLNREHANNIHPRALVGCMRIDSRFNAQLVPCVQLVVGISHFSISLKNNCKQKESEKKLPDILKHYKLSDDLNNIQAFLRCNLSNVKLHLCHYEDKSAVIQTDMLVSGSILDYSHLLIEPLIEEFAIKMFLEYGSTISVGIVSDEIRLRYGPNVGHTLLVSQQIWHQVLHNNNEYSPLISRYIFCNATLSNLQFGQCDTNEVIHLKSNESCFYAFRTDKRKEQLWFSFEDSNWIRSEAVSIYPDGIHLIKITDQPFLVMKIDRINGTQKKLVIKGQVEFLSMTEENLTVQYKVNEMKTEQERPIEFQLNGRMHTSVFTKCISGQNLCVRLRLNTDKQNGWSGEIPLTKSTAKNMPWLVKVPTTRKQQYVSYWVRIIREDIHIDGLNAKCKPQRILVIIWPLFMVRSMLTIATRVMEITTANRVYKLAGQGESVELSINGTHETEHDVIFEMRASNRHTNTKASLSYTSIDRNKFFEIPNHLMSIDSTISELEINHPIHWPCSKDEQLRWNHELVVEHFVQPIFKVHPSRELSCTLQLDVLPWSIFVNSIQCNVKIIADSESCIIPNNQIGVTFPVTENIIIGIAHYDQWIFSMPIYFSDTQHKELMGQSLSDDGSIIVKIESDVSVSKFLLTSSIENGVRVLVFVPYFVVCNFSTHKIHCWAFCAAKNEKNKLADPALEKNIGIYKIPFIEKLTSNPKGNGIDTFYNLSHASTASANNTLFDYFLSVKVRDSDFSLPFSLSRTYTRICFSIPTKSHSIPLALSVIENDGQQFICIHDDPCPVVEVINRTDLCLYIAESDIVSDKIYNSQCVDSENIDRIRYIPANRSLYYTPYSINKNFPDKVEHSIAVVIAYDKDPQSSLLNANVITQWSNLVKIYDSQELFLNLPTYGDVKIIVNAKEKVVKFIIDNIDYQSEFNVKDIRTKLSNPTFNNFPSPIDRETQSLPDHLVKTKKKSETELKYENNECSSHFPFGRFELNVFVSALNVILYNDGPENNCIKTELIAIYLDDIGLFLSEKCRSFEISLQNLQIDNQLFSSGEFDFPVVLTAQKQQTQRMSLPLPYALDALKSELQHNAAGSIRVQFYGTDYSIEQIVCNIQPIAAYIEDKYINCVLDFIVENIPSNLLYQLEEKSEPVTCKPGQFLIPKAIIIKAQSFSEPFRMRLFRIEPVQVLLSVHTCMRLYIALDHSPLDFGAFERKFIYSLPMRFGYNLGMHYISGAIFGAGWVVGSLEILGSPSGLARSVSTGLKDFLSMPVQGLLRGPWGFLVGITQGSASLLRNITAGTVNSVTKLAASVARNLDRLTLDEEHLQRTEALRRLRPQGIAHGLVHGLTGLGISILGAVGGLARHTLEAKSSAGIVRGIGKGLVGVVTKPISGAAELVALTGQGMLHTVGFNTMPLARRLTQPCNTSLGPSAAKIIWKYLPTPRTYISDQILFQALATLETRSGYSSIAIALTFNFIVIISIERDELIEIILNEQAFPEIDKTDPTMITLNVSKNGDNEGRETEMFQYRRVLQYVRDSSEQLPTTSNLSETNQTSENVVDEPTLVSSRKMDHKISLYMDHHLGEYFVTFVDLIKRNTKH